MKDSSSFENSSKKEGFTLLELLIVIGILAILGAVVIFVLNPAETLRETRDSQRISDLATIKTALGLYLTATSTPYLGATGDNTACEATPGATYAAGDRVFYSTPLNTASITDTTIDGSSNGIATQTPSGSLRNVGGEGWIPVHLISLASGAPLDAWPIDPTNSITTLSTVSATDLVYRFGCAVTPITFEIDARLEAAKNISGSSEKLTTDGGNNSSRYEAGTDLRILGTD